MRLRDTLSRHVSNIAHMFACIGACSALGVLGSWRYPTWSRYIIIGCCIVQTMSLSARAEVIKIGESGVWTAYEAVTTDGRVCFTLTRFIRTIGRGGDLSDPIYQRVSAYVAHRPDEQIYAEVSFQVFPDANGASSVSIDGKDYELVTQDDIAFAKTENSNIKILKAMKKGIDMRVSVDVRPAQAANASSTVVDEYSLIGLSRTLRMIDEACSKP